MSNWGELFLIVGLLVYSQDVNSASLASVAKNQINLYLRVRDIKSYSKPNNVRKVIIHVCK